MTNQPLNPDPKPEDSGDDAQQPGYTPPTYGAPGQGDSAPSGNNPPTGGGYTPPQYGAPNTGSGADAPTGGGYTPPTYGAPGQGYSAPSGNNPPSGGGYAPPTYGAPSTPDQSFGTTPSYGAPSQDPYGQPPAYGQQPGQAYGQPPGGPDPSGQATYGATPGGYGAPMQYGGAMGGYQPNPYGQTGPQLATWGRRAIGGLIDFVAPSVVVAVLLNVVMPNGGPTASLIQFVLVLGYWLFNTGYRVATTGYSFGHQIGKVRVVMADTGQTPPQNTALLRALCHVLDSWSCMIGWLFPLWDAKKQTFADKIAKTVVIDEQTR